MVVRRLRFSGAADQQKNLSRRGSAPRQIDESYHSFMKYTILTQMTTERQSNGLSKPRPRNHQRRRQLPRPKSGKPNRVCHPMMMMIKTMKMNWRMKSRMMTLRMSTRKETVVLQGVLRLQRERAKRRPSSNSNNGLPCNPRLLLILPS